MRLNRKQVLALLLLATALAVVVAARLVFL